MFEFLNRLAPIWQPHDGQRDFLTNKSKIKVLACGRRWGKTDACAAQIVTSLFDPEPSRHVIIAPTLDQAKILFDRTLELTEQLVRRGRLKRKPVVRQRPYPRFEFRGHQVIARSGHLGKSLRGNEATHIVIDEAAFVPEELVAEVAMPMLATTDGSLTLISTPRGKNHFFRFFQMGLTGEHGAWSRRAPSSESPYVSPGFLEVQREVISERAFQVEYEAAFLDSSSRLFKTESIDQCLVADLDLEPSQPLVIGVDWGRYTDFTAVAIVSGIKKEARLLGVERFQGMTWKDHVAKVGALARTFDQPLVVCDATGGGDVLYELLKEELPGVAKRDFVFSAKTKPGLIDNLVATFDNGYLRMLSHPDLLRELHHFEATLSPSGNTRMGAANGYHDDLVIALALACFHLPATCKPQIRVGAPRRFSRKGRSNRVIAFSRR